MAQTIIEEINCPCLICKWCSKEGHVRRFCPEQVKQEPVDQEAQQHEEDMVEYVTALVQTWIKNQLMMKS